MNSQAAVTWEDFLKTPLKDRVSDQLAATINKALVIFYGAIATGLAFLAPYMGGIIEVDYN
jgi:hypothetical protein